MERFPNRSFDSPAPNRIFQGNSKPAFRCDDSRLEERQKSVTARSQRHLPFGTSKTQPPLFACCA